MSDVLLVTGGCGFIGSNFVRHWLAGGARRVVVYDLMTYAARRENLQDIWDNPALSVVVGDIADHSLVRQTCQQNGVSRIVHFAAQSHVDQSILTPLIFTQTNTLGTHVLLEVCRELGLKFHQVSTDEVYGDVPAGERRHETDPVRPRSPYAASKAAAEQLALAYHITYDLYVTVTRGSNTVGPYQYPEKVLPLFATGALRGQPLPLYGDGLQQRDYMDVSDHCAAIETVLLRGESGGIYNVGTQQEIDNRTLAATVVAQLGADPALIRHVTDRPGHDRRYAVDTTRLRGLGWQPRFTPLEAVARAARWYADNPWWWQPILRGEFANYYQQQYSQRLRESAGEADQ